MEKLAVAAVGAVGAAYAADWWLGFSHDRKLANAGLKALEYMLRREAEGKASTVEPFITTARGPLRDKEFLVFEDYSATFGQIDEESNRLAQLLRASGVEPGQYVSILFQNSPQAVIAQLAVMKIGAAVAFLNFNLRGANLLHTFNLGGSKVVLFEDYCMDAAESIVNDISPDTKLICYGFKAASPEGPFVGRDFKGIDAAALASEFPDGQLDPGLELRKSIRLNTITATYFTSGTTGLPKAAIQRHSRLSTFPATISLGLGYLGTKDRILCELPLYHGSAQISLNICCITGATYIFTRKFSASNFWKEAIRTRATAMHHIGEAARYILAVPPSPLDRAHGVTKAIGNGLRADVWEPLMTRFGIKEVFEWYGASEGSTAFFHVQSGRDGIGKIGRMGYLARRVGNAKLFKVDPVTEELVRDPKTGLCIECAFNEPGEVLGKIVPPELSPVKASSFDGYYNDPKATEKKIRRDVVVKGDSWMAMGDLLSMDRRGWLTFVDRIGDTFRWRGENVSTTEVSNELQGFDDLLEANVYGVQVPGQDGRAGMAACTLREGISRDPANVARVMQRLGEYAAGRLPQYAIPKFIRLMPEMEVTGTFKHRKVEYVKQGFDPRTIPEPLFWYNHAKRAYEPMGVAEYQNIVGGKAKL